MKFKVSLREKVWRKADVIIEANDEEHLEELIDRDLDLSAIEWSSVWSDLEVRETQRLDDRS